MSMIEPTDIERRIADRLDTSIAGALEISRHAGGLSFTNAGEAMEFAKMMALSQIGVRKHLRGNVGACLAITIQSIEWGMSPFAVANKSYLVNDQIAYESQLVQAVILKRAPIEGRFKVEYIGEGAKRKCRVWAKLKGSDEIVDYTSPEFEKIKPKNSPLWQTDPDQQHFYYSGRALCRRHFPDVLLGVFDMDELEQSPRDPDRARDVTPPKTLAGRLDALAATPAHDAETGEVIEQETGAGPASQAAAEDASEVASAEPRDTAAADQSTAEKGNASSATDPGASTARAPEEGDGGSAPAAVPDELGRWREEGAKARAAGKSINNPPLDVRKDPAKLAAWREGHGGEEGGEA